MLSHLSLLEDAVRSLLEGHRVFISQYEALPQNRSLVAIARALRATHLSVEKFLKHVLMKVEPHLLLARPDTQLLLAIAKDRRHLQAPSFLATRVPFRTIDAVTAWNTVLEVLSPSITEHARSQFAAALKQLSEQRNQAQHSELYGDPSDFLLTLEQVYSQLRPVLEVLAPEAVVRLGELSDTIVPALRGIEERVDSGWVLLQDTLAEAGPLAVAFKVYVEMPGPDRNLEVFFTQARDTDSNSLSMLTTGARPDSSGLFVRLLSPDQRRSRLEAQVADLPVDQVPEPPDPPDPPLRGILGVLEDPLTAQLRIALHKRAERRRLAVEQFGLAPLEPGDLRLPPSPAWLAWVRPSDPTKKRTAKVMVNDCHLSFQAGDRRGSIGAVLAPNPDYPGAAHVTPLAMSGDVRLTGEYVVEEGTPSDQPPLGAVVRLLRAATVVTTAPAQ